MNPLRQRGLVLWSPPYPHIADVKSAPDQPQLVYACGNHSGIASGVTLSSGSEHFMESFRRINIPMEILRSVVAVAGTGSQSKAAALVGLSQPALSAHLKKIESLVGGSIFKKAASGSVPTDLGKLVIVQARRIIDSNDQLLRLRGDAEVSRSIRLE